MEYWLIDKTRKLPFLKLGVFAIVFIYLFLGIGEQSYNLIKGTTTTSETIQSIVALIIGSLFLFGGLKKWKLKKEYKRTTKCKRNYGFCDKFKVCIFVQSLEIN